jgi:hypothetical protein
MSGQRKLCFAAVCATLLTQGVVSWADNPATPAGAAAPEGGEGGIRLPVSVTERGITNPALILSPVLSLDIARAEIATGAIGPATAATALGVGVGAGFSITDDFGVRATALALGIPISPSGSAQYTGPTFGATYRFVKGDFELGAAVDVTIDTPAGAGAGVTVLPGIPMRLHLGKPASLDIVPSLSILAGPGTGSAIVGMAIPVTFLYDVVEPVFHLGAQTGFGILDFSEAGHTVDVPLGFLAGYAVPGPKGPVVDLDATFLWPSLFLPGATDGASAVQAGLFVVGVAATGYLYL